MKNIRFIAVLCLLFSLSSVAVFSQKISLAELHAMSSNKNWETSNKYLLSKGWEFHTSSMGDDEHYNTITWAFDKSYSNDNKANGWVYIYTYDGLPNKVMYRFRVKEYYSSIRKQLPANGYKLENEEIFDERVIATYVNANYILKLTYARETDDDSYYSAKSFTAYEITVYKKGGVYDPNNGKKQEFDADGNLEAEYVLKNGKINGELKVYNPNGTLKRTANYKMGVEDGITTFYYYDDNDNNTLIGKFFGSVKNDKKEGKWLSNFVQNGSERTLSFENYANDLKEGEFREVQGDSLIYGYYKNDLLNGKYKIFRDLKKMLIGGIIETDTTKLIKVTAGQYADDKRTGYWKNYHLSGLMDSEGMYADSLKTGIWKRYYDTYLDENDKETEYSGKLIAEELFYNGKKNGESVVYSALKEVSIPCEKPDEEGCVKFEFIPITVRATYRDDLLEGPFTAKNKAGVVLRKGNFLNGEPAGVWMEYSSSDYSFWPDKQTYETGNYINGKKEGKWERYDADNNLLESYRYQNGLISGEHLTFLKGKVTEKKLFSDGKLIKLEKLSNDGTVLKEYFITDEKPYSYYCRITSRVNDGELSGIYTNTYRVTKKDTENIHPVTFQLDIESDSDKVLNGLFERKTLDGKLVSTGNYTANKKTGTWEDYYYDQKVLTTFVYDGYGQVTSEYYYDLKRDEPFSGEFVYKTPESKKYEERKIKDGKRHGTTRYKDENDDTVKKETYKEGLLKED